jgi:hypothetical protein
LGNRDLRTGVFELPKDPKIADLHREDGRKQRLTMRTHSVGTILTYNPVTQTAKVSVDILQVIKDLNATPTAVNPNPTSIQAPVVLEGVPVYIPRSGVGPTLSYASIPIAPGDKGELHVQDRSIEVWKVAGLPTDPIAAWTHSMADAVFHPANFVKTTPLPATDQTAHVIEGPLVKLGRLATQPVIKGALFSTAMTVYTTAVSVAGAAHAAIVPPTSISNGAFITALTAATDTLAATIPTWPSIKVLTE